MHYLLFLKDKKKDRGVVLNVLLIVNSVFYFTPIIFSYLLTSNGESIWNENSGGGGALWLYIIVFPIAFIIQIILMALKINFKKQRVK